MREAAITILRKSGFVTINNFNGVLSFLRFKF